MKSLARSPWCLPLAGMLASCASGRIATVPETTIVVEPVAGTPTNGAETLPPLPVIILDDVATPEQRIQQIEAVEEDLRLVIRSLAERFGLNYQLDPAVTGSVTTRLQNVTLQEALDAIILPYGYTYTLQDNVLRVVPARMTPRIFTLDYVSMARTGIGTTVIQRRLGVTGNLGGAGGQGGAGSTGAAGGTVGGSFGGGADIIESVTVADLWEEIRVALDGLIFSAEGTTTPAAQGAVGSASGPTASSRVDEEGRRLIINPMAGTILVAAPPEKLQEVAALIAAIEGSVHRQVLIEARIVEIALNEEFQFGIDWSLVQRLGNVDIDFGVDQNGTQLTIATGGDAESQIGIVLRALESQGSVDVLSAPRVSVLNNQRATINVATDEVFFSVTRNPILGPNGTVIDFETQIVPQQIAVGIVLDVLPQISANNTITMNVRPAITDIVEIREILLDDGTQASAPVIDRRETDTVVRVRDGETLVIGGLMRTARETERTGIPGLSRIPWLGQFFGGYREVNDKRELVIFMTPTIIAGQPTLAP